MPYMPSKEALQILARAKIRAKSAPSGLPLGSAKVVRSLQGHGLLDQDERLTDSGERVLNRGEKLVT